MSLDKNSNLIINITGIAYLFAVRCEVVDSGSTFFKKVFLQPGYSFKPVYFTPGTASLEEIDKQEDAGILVEQTIKFTIPGEDDDNTEMVAELRRYPLVIRISLDNGKQKLIGIPANPARFLRKHKISGKMSASEITISCTSQDSSYWISYEGPPIPH